MRFTTQQVSILFLGLSACANGALLSVLDINQGNFPTHSVKIGLQCFGLRCDVTVSPYKTIWTHVALHHVTGIELLLFLLCQYAFTCTIFQL